MIDVRIRIDAKQDTLRQGFRGTLTVYERNRKVGLFVLRPAGSEHQAAFYPIVDFYFALDARFLKNTTFEVLNHQTGGNVPRIYVMKLSEVLDEVREHK